MLNLTRQEKLSNYLSKESIDSFVPDEQDILITLLTLSFYSNQTKDLSNLRICFTNCFRFIKRKFLNL